jgi:uncharacterized repeat protein (TIGR03803 family)
MVCSDEVKFSFLRVCVKFFWVVWIATIALPSYAQTYTILYSFTGKADGSDPTSPLLRNSAGDLFGTTAQGGQWGAGVLFKFSSSGKETVLASFSNAPVSGTPPTGQIARDSTGNFYGTTQLGGSSASGSLYTVNKTGGETVLFSFHQYVGQLPVGGVTIDSAGNVYGTTGSGGSTSTDTCSCGVVFEFTSGGTYKVLHRFKGGLDGKYPASGLLRDSLGNLYGATAQGGGCALSSLGCGTVFKVSATGVEKILHRFAGGTDGLGPGDLIRDSNGNFYGTTAEGGTGTTCTYGCGTVFRMDASGNVTILHSFQGGPDDGTLPSGPLVRDADGNLYGVTALGGSSSKTCSALNFGYGCGTVFKLEPSGNETILHAFAGSPTDGAGPLWGLIRDSSGNLYGVTQGGGPNDAGTIFKITP